MKCLVVSDIEASREEKVQFLHEMNLFSSVGSASSADQTKMKLRKYTYGIILLDFVNSKIIAW